MKKSLKAYAKSNLKYLLSFKDNVSSNTFDIPL